MSAIKSDALVLFGATGDLAHKKLFDTIQALYRRGVLEGPVIGVAKSGMTREQVIARAREGITTFGRGVDETFFKKFEEGFQYVDGDYIAALRSAGIERSMSRAGNCYDNAAMESFWSSLKSDTGLDDEGASN